MIAELGVSQTPVREALSRLEGQGLAVREPMKGYTVAPPLDAADVEKLMGVRMLLEPDDVSNAVLYLASEEARYVTGTTHVVDAGGGAPYKLPHQ